MKRHSKKCLSLDLSMISTIGVQRFLCVQDQHLHFNHRCLSILNFYWMPTFDIDPPWMPCAPPLLTTGKHTRWKEFNTLRPLSVESIFQCIWTTVSSMLISLRRSSERLYCHNWGWTLFFNSTFVARPWEVISYGGNTQLTSACTFCLLWWRSYCG